MWILHLLPDSFLVFVANALLLIGTVLAIAGLVAQRIPVVWRYQLPFKIAGLVLFAAGIYFRGGLGVEQDWRERVKEAQDQVQAAEQRAHEYSDKLDQVTRERDALLKRKSQVIIERVDRVVIDPRCEKLPQEIIDIHNDATRMNIVIEEIRKAGSK